MATTPHELHVPPPCSSESVVTALPGGTLHLLREVLQHHQRGLFKARGCVKIKPIQFGPESSGRVSEMK